MKKDLQRRGISVQGLERSVRRMDERQKFRMWKEEG
jgi:hypothetical protein